MYVKSENSSTSLLSFTARHYAKFLFLKNQKLLYRETDNVTTLRADASKFRERLVNCIVIG